MGTFFSGGRALGVRLEPPTQCSTSNVNAVVPPAQNLLCPSIELSCRLYILHAMVRYTVDREIFARNNICLKFSRCFIFVVLVLIIRC